MTTWNEEGSASGVSSWDNAVEHIHPESNKIDEILRFSNSHQISWPVLRQVIYTGSDRLHHQISGFAHGYSSYGVPVELHFGKNLCGLSSEIRICSALYDTE